MPRKIQITKKQILGAAIDYIREHGIETISTRKIASYLNCSTQPIYSYFENQQALIESVYQEIYDRMCVYMTKETDDVPFLQMGLGVIQFAKQESKLFRCLYFTNNNSKLKHKNFNALIRTTEEIQSFSEETLKKLHLDLSIYTHGLACLVMDHPELYTDHQIKNLLIHAAQCFSGENQNSFD